MSNRNNYDELKGLGGAFAGSKNKGENVGMSSSNINFLKTK